MRPPPPATPRRRSFTSPTDPTRRSCRYDRLPTRRPGVCRCDGCVVEHVLTGKFTPSIRRPGKATEPLHHQVSVRQPARRGDVAVFPRGLSDLSPLFPPLRITERSLWQPTTATDFTFSPANRSRWATPTKCRIKCP